MASRIGRTSEEASLRIELIYSSSGRVSADNSLYFLAKKRWRQKKIYTARCTVTTRWFL